MVQINNSIKLEANINSNNHNNQDTPNNNNNIQVAQENSNSNDSANHVLNKDNKSDTPKSNGNQPKSDLEISSPLAASVSSSSRINTSTQESMKQNSDSSKNDVKESNQSIPTTSSSNFNLSQKPSNSNSLFNSATPTSSNSAVSNKQQLNVTGSASIEKFTSTIQSNPSENLDNYSQSNTLAIPVYPSFGNDSSLDGQNSVVKDGQNSKINSTIGTSWKVFILCLAMALLLAIFFKMKKKFKRGSRNCITNNQRFHNIKNSQISIPPLAGMRPISNKPLSDKKLFSDSNNIHPSLEASYYPEDYDNEKGSSSIPYRSGFPVNRNIIDRVLSIHDDSLLKEAQKAEVNPFDDDYSFDEECGDEILDVLVMPGASQGYVSWEECMKSR
ncbi:hypothetical protein G9A89_003497 [Geosiphon pyriformis]|nr:hypothetical protein G9A89_003497 [Geosiphon pyriformis]